MPDLGGEMTGEGAGFYKLHHKITKGNEKSQRTADCSTLLFDRGPNYRLQHQESEVLGRIHRTKMGVTRGL